MRIVISEFMDETAVARLAAEHDTLYDKGSSIVPKRCARELADADALIVRNRTQVDRDLVGAAPSLKVVGRLGVGLDNIDVDACRARAIEVIPATGANALAVAEYVIGAAMFLLRGAYRLVGGGRRRAMAARRALQRPRAGRQDARHRRLRRHRPTCRPARARARHARDRIRCADRLHPRRSGATRRTAACDLDALLAEADVVTLHVPLVDSTRHLIDAARLARMKPGAILINTARGGVVDEVRRRSRAPGQSLGGAALDVFEQEPLPAGSPLAGCPNLLLTPHIAGVTAESNTRVSDADRGEGRRGAVALAGPSAAQDMRRTARNCATPHDHDPARRIARARRDARSRAPARMPRWRDATARALVYADAQGSRRTASRACRSTRRI